MPLEADLIGIVHNDRYELMQSLRFEYGTYLKAQVGEQAILTIHSFLAEEPYKPLFWTALCQSESIMNLFLL